LCNRSSEGVAMVFEIVAHGATLTGRGKAPRLT
jgi:hypothetical protein